ncbi:PREDICTED: uncharacterized protein LOC106815099 [Priapulus caudatus]|uniref:Uncharacterized protein LOC106815099 n=1 Tax=Priapulus caudatus TaxID=37621 RepID=A0ABM1ES40_PRICU|nr:PREDICTED: uncharacterized protein LOC106815099 [Priapulus caudatus]
MELAAMSDNLTTVVQSLYNHSLVSDLPRFRSRMRDAGNTITLLVRNLRNAESVNDEVFSTVLELNDTLEELTEAMLEQVPLLDEINGTLVVMENVTGQAMDMMSETNTTLYKVFQLLRGSIIQLDTRIQNLVNDLHDKEHLVLLLARDTITKLNGLANVTQLLQNQTMQAAQLIESGAQLLKSTQEKQRNNTLQVEDLQKLLEQLRDLNRTLYEAATRTRVDTNTVRATIDVIFSKVLSTEISQDSHSALVNDAIRLKQAAQTLLQKSVMQTTKAHLLSTEVRTAQGETSRFQDFVSLVQV